MERKVGRPTENPKNVSLQLRITADTDQYLRQCAEEAQVSRTKIIEDGILLVKNRRERTFMDITEVRKKSVDGAVKFLENEIEKAAGFGKNFVDFNVYDALYMDDQVLEYFKEKGYEISSGEIKW